MNLDKLLDKMEEIVEKNVFYYKSDFYDHDIANIGRYHGDMFWIVRDSGTFLIPVDNVTGSTEMFNAVMLNYDEIIIHHINENNGEYTIREITPKEAREIENSKQKWEIIIESEFIKLDSRVGNFTTYESAMAKAKEVADLYSEAHDIIFYPSVKPMN